MLERQGVGQAIENARWDRHVLGEGAVPPVVRARDAEHHPVVAEIHLAAPAELAATARDGGIERDAIAPAEAFDAGADPLDDARRLVAHHQRWNAAAARPV